MVKRFLRITAGLAPNIGFPVPRRGESGDSASGKISDEVDRARKIPCTVKEFEAKSASGAYDARRAAAAAACLTHGLHSAPAEHLERRRRPDRRARS